MRQRAGPDLLLEDGGPEGSAVLAADPGGDRGATEAEARRRIEPSFSVFFVGKFVGRSAIRSKYVLFINLLVYLSGG